MRGCVLCRFLWYVFLEDSKGFHDSICNLITLYSDIQWYYGWCECTSEVDEPVTEYGSSMPPPCKRNGSSGTLESWGVANEAIYGVYCRSSSINKSVIFNGCEYGTTHRRQWTRCRFIELQRCRARFRVKLWSITASCRRRRIQQPSWLSNPQLTPPLS